MTRDEGAITLLIEGRNVRVTHPERLYFSKPHQITKLELVEYYARVATGALQGIRARPIVLKRFVHGAEAPPFYQKRAPEGRPPWIRSVTLRFPSGNTAEEIVVDDIAGLIWIVNLGCLELHPHPTRADDLEHPDELRIDLDPGPGVEWKDVIVVALEVNEVLSEHGLVGFPKTSGSRGMHINARIAPSWTFTELRNAALAVARAVERRVPKLATSKWWKDERHGVFLDYNQNAKDRTTCSAYSVRPLPDARVSAPLTWSEVPDCNPADFTLFTMPKRFAELGDPHAGMDAERGSLESLLELAARDAAAGVKDAPWPGEFRGGGTRGGATRRRGTAHDETKRVEKPSAPSAEQQTTAAKPAAKTRRRATPDAPADAKPTVAKSRSRAKAALLVIAKSANREAALAGLERWLHAHADVAAHLAVEDILVDSMRGRSTNWWRVRVNLRHVPAEMRPKQEKPDPDQEP